MIENDIKHNLKNLEETLNQCSIDSQAQLDGNATEMKAQLDRMTVNSNHYLFLLIRRLYL